MSDGDELFYRTGGKKDDQAIHDQILANPEGEKIAQLISRKLALMLPGVKPSDLDEVYRASKLNRFL